MPTLAVSILFIVNKREGIPSQLISHYPWLKTELLKTECSSNWTELTLSPTNTPKYSKSIHNISISISEEFSLSPRQRHTEVTWNMMLFPDGQLSSQAGIPSHPSEAIHHLFPKTTPDPRLKECPDASMQLCLLSLPLPHSIEIICILRGRTAAYEFEGHTIQPVT